MRQRAVVGLGVLMLAAVVLGLWSRGPRPCRATFEQVCEGMTFEDVCATVGGPPGTYSSRQRYTFLSVGPPAGCHHVEWRAADGILYVVFNSESGNAVFVHRFDPPPDSRTFLQYLRARLSL